MTGHPAASADAVSPPQTPKASGKLLGVNTATGPIDFAGPPRPRIVRGERGRALAGLVAADPRRAGQFEVR